MSIVSDRLLRHVNRPARYTGGEWNSVRKPWGRVGLRVCLAFPDIYEAGVLRPVLSSLYQILNEDPDVLAERVFAPWPDFARLLRSEGLPLFSTESGQPVSAFDIIAVCLPGGLAATTVLEVLDLAGLPLEAAERDERHPLVVAWEETPINPEPLAAFIDLFLVGDPEVLLPSVLHTWRELGGGPGRPPSRADLLRRLTTEQGVYVPSLHHARRDADGPSDAPQPRDGANPMVQRVVWEDLLPVPTRPIVPYLQAISDRPVIELQRGCDGTACPPARAGLAAPPLRQRPPQAVAHALRAVLQATGFDEIELGSPCLGDHPDAEAVVAAAAEVCSAARAKLRLPPIALELLTPGLLAPLEDTRSPLTLGPVVAGSDLLPALAPGGAFVEPLSALGKAASRDSLGGVRLEIVLGHPEGSNEGIEAAAGLARAVRRAVGGQVQIRVATSFFVPRVFTPWQRHGQLPIESLQDQMAALRGLLGRKYGPLSGIDAQMVHVEAALTRGDRRLGAVVRRAWSSGCVLDAWGELSRSDLWRQAFQAEGLDLETYATRDMEEAEPLPWGHLGDPSAEDSVVHVKLGSQTAPEPRVD